MRPVPAWSHFTAQSAGRFNVMPLLKLDPMEKHFFVPSPLDGLKLFLRCLPAHVASTGKLKIVLYVHAGTIPSSLSIAHRFNRHSWRDELVDAGFEVWGLDFQGFGGSDR